MLADNSAIKLVNNNQPKILAGQVFHKRYAMRRHSFCYRHWCFYLPVIIQGQKQTNMRRLLQCYETRSDQNFWTNLQNNVLEKFLSLIVTWEKSDYGNHRKSKIKQDGVKKILQLLQRKLNWQPMNLELVTQGRVLFYVFNPVSFWLARDIKNELKAIVAEVHNTYGEFHYYLLTKPDLNKINNHDVFWATKEFHVSPYFQRQGQYRFQFVIKPNFFSARIQLWHISKATDKKIGYKKKLPIKELQLDTGMTMAGRNLTAKELWRVCWQMPLQPFKVIIMIHFHAVYLFFKKIRFITLPKALPKKITMANWQA